MASKKLYVLMYLILSVMISYMHATMTPIESKEKKEYAQLQENTGNTLLNILPQEILGIISDYSQGYFDDEEIINKPQARYPLHKKSVTCLLALPSNNVLSGSADKTIKEFDPKTGKVARTYFDQEWVTCLYPVNNEGFLSGSYDRTMKEWTTGDKGGLKAIYQDATHGHKQAVTCMTVLKDGTFLSGSRDGSIVAWNPKTQKIARSYNGHTGDITALKPLANGDFMSESSDKTHKEWNGATGKTKNTYKKPICFIVPLKSGNAVISNGKKMIEINGKTGKEIRTYGRTRSDITNIALLPSGNIISSMGDATIIEWDTTKGRPARVYQDASTSPITSLVVLPSGSILAGSEDGVVREWNPNPKSSAELALDKHQATAKKTPKQPLPKKDGL